jgi:hypothetical protein
MNEVHSTQMAKNTVRNDRNKTDFLKIRELNRMKMKTGYPQPVILASN